MRFYLFLLALLLAAPGWAQQSGFPASLVNAGYNWDVQRKQRLPITPAEAELPAIFLKDFTSIEYYFDERTRGQHV